MMNVRIGLAILFGLLCALPGCEEAASRSKISGSQAPVAPVVAILDDASMSNYASLTRVNDALMPLFRSACQHHWQVGIFRATAAEANPLQVAGVPVRAVTLMEQQRTASQPSVQNGTDLYTPAMAIKAWLSQPAFEKMPKTLLLITDGHNDPTKINGQTRQRFRSLFDVDLSSLSSQTPLHIEVIGVDASDVSRIRANWPTACVHIKGTEAEAVTPGHLGLPDYEDEIF